MLSIALTRLRSRLGLTLLSLAGVTLAVALVVSIPVFSVGISFVMLQEELGAAGRDMIAHKAPRPPYSIRFLVQPRNEYELPVDHTAVLESFIAETIAAQTGLPVLGSHRQMESQGLLVRQWVELPGQKARYQTVFQGTRLVVIPDAEPHLATIDGRPMSEGAPGEPLELWIHHTSAKYGVDDGTLGLRPGVQYQLYDARTKIEIPIEIAGSWAAADPLDTFWPADPDHELRQALLVRESDYRALLEPVFERQLRQASWHVVLDHDQLTPENVRRHAEGLRSAKQDVEMRLAAGSTESAPKTDSPLLDALDAALKRQYDLTILMFALSVPIFAFLLYFMSLISSIAIRWQQRETAIMVSRGMRRGQLLRVTLYEALILMLAGVPLGTLLGQQLAQAMGYTASFLRFDWRPPLPVSSSAANVPLLVAALSALLVARIWPLLRSAGTSVVAHERGRARAARKPLWQRFYLDFLLILPVTYAVRQLHRTGTLLPSLGAEQAAKGLAGPLQIAAPTVETATAFQSSPQDPLLFLAPALFALLLSLLLVRLFPLLMRLGDSLSALGRRPASYLAFRQLSRRSSQYASALLLVIAALALGGFMASLAASMDHWLVDQVYYDIGSDVLVEQMYNPTYLVDATVPQDGAWMLPPSTYHSIPGVVHAARAGLYPASIHMSSYEIIRGTYIGVDRLDLPQVLAYRPDFASEPLGTLMNRLAAHPDGVLVSERFLYDHNLAVGDAIPIVVTLVDLFDKETILRGEFYVAGTYRHFPTVYEHHEQEPAVIGNLDYLYNQVGGPELHDIWLKTAPDADPKVLRQGVAALKVYVRHWRDARATLTTQFAQPERVGTLGTLALGFLAAAILSGIGLLIYNYASLQERLFRFSILRAVGLTRRQIVIQVALEYVLVMVYGVAGGTGIGVWAALWFVPYFQAAEAGALRPPPMLPTIAWGDIGTICAAFAGVLILAQITLLLAALRKGVFQSLRLGDRE
jgi:putative ABC transport system permease protein